MAKTFFSVIAALMFAQYATSQNRVGIKAGLNISYLQEKFTPENVNTEALKPLLGYQFGIFYKVSVNTKWSLSSEVNFSLVGGKFPYYMIENGFDSLGSTQYRNNSIGYLEVPVSVQYNIHNFYVGVGPGLAFHLFSKGFDSGSYTTNHKAVDVAANVIGGYNITKKLRVDLRYSYGLMNVVKDDFKNLGGSYNTEVSLKNRFFNVSLLYSLK